MIEISHRKAKTLLQAAADQAIDLEEKSALDAHLAKCKECNDYANSVINLEARLLNVMHTHWDNRRPNLNLKAIINPSQAEILWKNFSSQTHAMGKVTLVAALLLGYIVISNLFGIRLPISGNETPTTIPTPNEFSLTYADSPTPSAWYTLAGLPTQTCETIYYIFQAEDTLENVALLHGITKEEILEYNKIKSNTELLGRELVIPLCKGTPSQTTTMTITPLSGTIFPVQPE